MVTDQCVSEASGTSKSREATETNKSGEENDDDTKYKNLQTIFDADDRNKCHLILIDIIFWIASHFSSYAKSYGSTESAPPPDSPSIIYCLHGRASKCGCNEQVVEITQVESMNYTTAHPPEIDSFAFQIVFFVLHLQSTATERIDWMAWMWPHVRN